MNPCVAIIGVDGMDSRLVEGFLDDLPIMRSLIDRGAKIPMSSVFPPDTTPAWTSIYKSENPARHGVVNFVNPRDRSGGYKPIEIHDDLYRGRTFWDVASEEGARVCVILPCNIYPGWPINGVMVTRSNRMELRPAPLISHPEGALRGIRYRKRDINLMHGFVSASRLGALVEHCRRRIETEEAVGIHLARREPWDLFFIYFSTMDAIQHYFWNAFDATHPNYSEGEAFRDVIREFYIAQDRSIGRILDSLRVDPVTIVMSDHGHGSRPYKTVNINELLRREGFLHPKVNADLRERRLLGPDRLKRSVMAAVKKFGTGYILMRLSKAFPAWKRLLAPSSNIDWERTFAWATDLSSVKSYSYGGIRTRRDRDGARDLEDEIMECITRLKEPESGRQLVRWIVRREELYQGPHLDKYPELVVELEEGYGMGWEIGGELFGVGAIHTIQPGAHRRDSAVLVCADVGNEFELRERATILDVSPTVLRVLGVNKPEWMEGESILMNIR